MSPPKSIAHYPITSKLGGNGMGAVFRELNGDDAASTDCFPTLPSPNSGQRRQMRQISCRQDVGSVWMDSALWENRSIIVR